MYNTIVFGASGQLGQCLQELVKLNGNEGFKFLSESEADILDPDMLRSAFLECRPVFCVNCAAYTAVDKAEDEISLAREINKDGVANLAKLCKEFNVKLIHISTDFVFSGNGSLPLTENEPASPVNVYGLTKLEGEQEVQRLLKEHFIIRTSWLYSEFGNNFVKTMLRLGKEKEELRVIWDQIGTPTYAMDLAGLICKIITEKNESYGLYHYSNEGLSSWFDFAKAIFELSNIQVKLHPIRTIEYPTRAQRPFFSVMDKSRIKNTANIEIPYWRDSLRICINKLQLMDKLKSRE